MSVAATVFDWLQVWLPGSKRRNLTWEVFACCMFKCVCIGIDYKEGGAAIRQDTVWQRGRHALRLGFPGRQNHLPCLIEASFFLRAVNAATKKIGEPSHVIDQGRTPYEDRVLWQYGAVPRMWQQAKNHRCVAWHVWRRRCAVVVLAAIKKSRPWCVSQPLASSRRGISPCLPDMPVHFPLCVHPSPLRGPLVLHVIVIVHHLLDGQMKAIFDTGARQNGFLGVVNCTTFCRCVLFTIDRFGRFTKKWSCRFILFFFPQCLPLIWWCCDDNVYYFLKSPESQELHCGRNSPRLSFAWSRKRRRRWGTFLAELAFFGNIIIIVIEQHCYQSTWIARWFSACRLWKSPRMRSQRRGAQLRHNFAFETLPNQQFWIDRSFC